MLTELRYEPRWAFMVEIHGVRQRFYGVRRRPGATFDPPPAALRPPTASHEFGDHIDVPALVMVHSTDEATDGLGGVAEHTPTTIELARADFDATRATWAPLDDPAIVLGRLPIPAGGHLREKVGPADLEWPVFTDLSALPFPVAVHMGQEVARATGFLGADASSYRLVLDRRGAMDTIARSHLPTPSLGEYPAMWFDHCRTWHHRPARLLAAPIYGDMFPKLGDWQLVHPGLLEIVPNTDRPEVVEIEISPRGGWVDRRMDFGRQQTTLVEGWHVFTEEAANIVEVHHGFQRDAIYEGETIATGALAGVLNVDGTSPHEEFTDVTLPMSHPRAGRVEVVGGRIEDLLVRGYVAGPPAAFNIPNNRPKRAVAAGRPVHSMAQVETKRSWIVELGGARRIVEWPGVLAELDADLAPGTIEGEGGSWLDAFFDAGSGTLRTFGNWDPRQYPAFAPRTFLYDPHVSVADPLAYELLPPWPFAQAGTPFPRPKHVAADGTVSGPVQGKYLLHYPLLRHDDEDPRNGQRHSMGRDGAWFELYGSRSVDGRAEGFDALTVALGFYQRGERHILTKGRISHPDGWPATVGVVYEEPWVRQSTDGPPRRQSNLIEIAGDEVIALGDGTTAYLLEVANPDATRSFGTFDGAEPAMIQVDFPQVTGPELLEQILTAEYALGIPADAIDLDSLYRFTDPPGMSFGWPTVAEPIDGREALRGVLVATRTALATRLATGGKLTRVYIGPENAADVIGTFTDDDWIAGQLPTYQTAREVIHELTIRCNYGADGEPAVIERFINRTLNAESGFDLKEEDLDLQGVLVDQRQARTDLLPVAAAIFASFGRPRRIWTLPIELGQSLALHIGACVRVTSEHLRGAADTVGVVGAVARVIEISRDWMAGTAEVVAYHWGQQIGGYAPCIEIIGVVNANTVEVDPTARAGIDPLTGAARTVWDLFQLNDRVRVVPDGGDDVALTRRIVAWDQVADPPTVTFGPVNDGGPDGHSITTTGYVEPAAGDAMEPHHQVYARLGAGFVFG